MNEVAELCGKVYPLAFNPANIQGGFRATGIWPLNQNIFQDHKFLSSAVTDRPDPTHCTFGETTRTQQQQSASVEDHDCASPVPSKGHSSHVSPEDVRPVPTATPGVASNRGLKKGRYRIQTDLPEKERATLTAISEMKSTKQKVVFEDSSSSKFSTEDSSDTESDDEMNSTNNLPRQNEEGIFQGDFWLTQQGKKAEHHYVAEVIQVLDMDNEVSVKGLKRLSPTDKFLRNSEEVYTITEEFQNCFLESLGDQKELDTN
jgi:hypothetical protein